MQISELSKQGFKDALIALMKSSISWYGKTVEGSEFHNELLWNIYQQKTKLTLQALSEIEPHIRKEIIAKDYEQPLLDYNYTAILDSLRDFEPRDSFVLDFGLLKSRLEQLAENEAKN